VDFQRAEGTKGPVITKSNVGAKDIVGTKNSQSTKVVLIAKDNERTKATNDFKVLRC